MCQKYILWVPRQIPSKSTNQKFPVNWRGERREFLEKLNPASFPVCINIFASSELFEKGNWQTKRSKETVETTNNRLAPFFSLRSSVLYTTSGVHICRPMKTGWIVFHQFNRLAKHGIRRERERDAPVSNSNIQEEATGGFRCFLTTVNLNRYAGVQDLPRI